MPSILSTQTWKQQYHRARNLCQSVLIGTGASLLCWSGSANATEVINLQYKGLEATIPTDSLVDFARTGNLSPEFESFLVDISEDVPDILQTILVTELRLSPDFIQNLLGSSIGQFAVVQLEQAVNSGEVDDSLAFLKTTIEESVADDSRISILEIIERYPMESVNLDVSGLESIYLGVANFVEGLQPTLSNVVGLLQGFLCDCASESDVTIDLPESEEVDDALEEVFDEDMSDTEDLESSLPTKSNEVCPTTLNVKETEDGFEVENSQGETITLSHTATE